jgi:hypothetical protein
MARRVVRGFMLGAAAIVVAACGGHRALSVLDESTGVTLVRGRAPLVFARTEPRYSRSGRDYVYLGPVETNRQGVREYYLWVGVGSTIDRGFLAPEAETPETLYLDLRGEPIELPLKPWREVVALGGRRSIYDVAVPLRAELAARVTLQQLTLLDTEPITSIRVAAGGSGIPRTYPRWDQGGGFADFLGAVGQPTER